MADEVLSNTADLDNLSFYGLSHHLGEVTEARDRLLLIEGGNPEEDESLQQVQTNLRREMGARLVKPSLSKREKPLAKKFISEQLPKLVKLQDSDERASRAVARLKDILESIASSPVATESRHVRKAEADLKKLEDDWKELAPLYDKWEAGRHSFKSNPELQAFKKSYETCKKGLDTAPDVLMKALCIQRTAADAAWRDPEEAKKRATAAGWAAVDKSGKSTAPAVAPSRRVAAAPRTAPKGVGWSQGQGGGGDMTLAQRLRADLVSQVQAETQQQRAEAEQQQQQQQQHEASNALEEEDQDVDEDQERGEDAEHDVVAARPPPPPHKPANAAGIDHSGSGGFWDDEAIDTGETDVAAKAGTTAPTNTASAKKKGKVKQKKKNTTEKADDDGEDDALEGIPLPAPKKPAKKAAWVARTQAALRGSFAEELFLPGSWSMLDERLELCQSRLPLSNPIGLALSMEWSEFVALSIDGGPKHTSRRGASPGVLRLQMNIPFLLSHYLILIFFASLMQAISDWGLLALAAVAQFGLILAPADVPHLSKSARVMLLQVVHLGLLLLFVYSSIRLHLFIKMGIAMAVAGHAYVVNCAPEDE